MKKYRFTALTIMLTACTAEQAPETRYSNYTMIQEVAEAHCSHQIECAGIDWNMPDCTINYTRDLCRLYPCLDRGEPALELQEVHAACTEPAVCDGSWNDNCSPFTFVLYDPIGF